LSEHPWCLAHFQWVQETTDRIVFNLVKGAAYDAKVVTRIVAHVQAEVADEGITVQSALVDRIPRARSGKRKYMVSHVERGYRSLHNA